MDLRGLRYFLTIVEEGSIIKAADILHVTQPTLSRQMKDLENECKTTLFQRGNKSQRLVLTEKGLLMKARAEEILSLVHKTEEDMLSEDDFIGGTIVIGGAESDAMKIVAEAAKELRYRYPGIHFKLYSGNAEDVKEKLDNGLLDFGIFSGLTDMENYSSLMLPAHDYWGLLVRTDSDLADKKSITPSDLFNRPLLVSSQKHVLSSFCDMYKINLENLDIVGTYNLLFNASLMVQEGVASALCLDKIINTSDSSLRFIPLMPKHDINLYLSWKKYAVFSKASEMFLKSMKEFCK